MPGDPDRLGQRGRVPGVLVVAPDQHHALTGLDQPGQLRAEPGAQRGDADRARDVRLVELELGAHVHDQRAVGAGLVHLARRQRVHVAAVRPPAARG